MAYSNGKNSEFGQDSINEKELGKFLDKYFYNTIFVDTERVHDSSRQHLGMDVIVNDFDKPFIIDEKGMSSIIGQLANNTKPAPTFCLECSAEMKDTNPHKKNKERVEGWFLREDIVTDAYLFCWYKDCKVDKNPKMDDIKALEVMLVNKKELQEHLSEHGLTPQVIKKNAADILDLVQNHPEKLEGEQIKGRFRNGYCDGFKKNVNGKTVQSVHFFYSPRWAEQPLNIIVRKEEFEKLHSTRKWEVTPDKVVEYVLPFRKRKSLDMDKNEDFKKDISKKQNELSI